jgi:hypothetical protein
MADTIAKLNVTTSWVSTGTSDTITCQDVSPLIRNGVQIDADGFDLATATINVTTRTGAVKTANAPTGAGETCLVGQGFSIQKIVISGIAAGTYPVTFSQ